MRIKEILIGLIPAGIVAGVLSMMNPQVATNIATVGLSLFLMGFTILAGLTLGGRNERV